MRGRKEKDKKPRRRTLTPSNFLLAWIGFLFLLSASVVLVLNFRALYYFDIDYLKLEQESGLSGEVIRENYDVLIDYNLITKQVSKLEFPDFPMSETGEIHFREVRQIFYAVQYLGIAAGALFLAGLLFKLFRRDFGFLRILSVLAFLVPAALGVLALTGWEDFFTGFHSLFFQNDYWLFDPATDPVILILPDAFFAQCAALVLLLVLTGGLLSHIVCRLLWRKPRKASDRI